MSHCTDDRAPAATAHQLEWTMMMTIMTLVAAANVSQFNYNCRYTECIDCAAWLAGVRHYWPAE